MKIWIETWKVIPPHNRTISGRFGASVMFVAYSQILDQWLWIQPGGREEKIPEPIEIYLDEEWIAAHPKAGGIAREKPNRIRVNKSEQLSLF